MGNFFWAAHDFGQVKLTQNWLWEAVWPHNHGQELYQKLIILAQKPAHFGIKNLKGNFKKKKMENGQKMVKKQSKPVKMVQNGPKWFQMVPNSPKWSNMV